MADKLTDDLRRVCGHCPCVYGEGSDKRPSFCCKDGGLLFRALDMIGQLQADNERQQRLLVAAGQAVMNWHTELRGEDNAVQTNDA